MTAPESSANLQAASPWHAIERQQVLELLGSDAEHGLSAARAGELLVAHGPNTLVQEKHEPWWEEALESLTEPLQLLLIAVAAVYFWLGEKEDAFTILAVIVAVAGIEVFSELRAKRAVASLASLSAPQATALRQGELVELPARDLAPGDVVLLAAGARVPADLRLLDSTVLRVDESSLTGESVPVAKNAAARPEASAPLAERVTMLFSGTLVTAGKARAVVVGTGMQTELGRIAGLVRQAREPKTPLQVALAQLSRWLLWAAIGFSLLVPLLGVLLAGRPVREMVLVGLTLAFATIPEELPILITMVLGLGAWRLAGRHAIVKGLKAAETLGSVSVIATDKTGTLTLNEMRLVSLLVGTREVDAEAAATSTDARAVIEAAVLANDAQAADTNGERQYIGDPTETALLRAADDAGMDCEAIRRGFEAREEFPFTDDRKRMSILGIRNGRWVLAAKGSPESILSVCTAWREGERSIALDEAARAAIQARADAMAEQGRRLLAVASRELDTGPPPSTLAASAMEQDLVLLGLVALEDPPRPEAAAAVEELQRAGVRVLMVTGDHPSTAAAIAKQVGIATSEPPVHAAELASADAARASELVRRRSIFARSTPQDKLTIVQALQAQGEVVAVTGDGVNDAPALKQAAIGVAMGRSGTAVAREASSLILADDNFATVTQAVRTGRTLFANLRKAVRYYLAAKVALVTASLAAVLLKLPVPFEPVQIILMELFMDLGASITFVAERPERDLMAQPPRDPRKSFMDRTMQIGILLGGAALGAAVLIGYLGAIHLGASIQEAQTVAFVAWMVGHVVLAANMRTEREPVLRGGALVTNRPFLVWAAAAFAVTAVGVAWAPARHQFHLAIPPASAVAVACTAAVALPFLWEAWKWLTLRRA